MTRTDEPAAPRLERFPMHHRVALLGPDGQVAQVPRHAAGAQPWPGGTTNAVTQVPYLYNGLYTGLALGLNPWCESRAGGPAGPFTHFRPAWLHGRSAGETRAVLERAVALLGHTPAPSPQHAWPGQAGFALLPLLDWGAQHPNGVWDVDSRFTWRADAAR